jgi:hypothetical protein
VGRPRTWGLTVLALDYEPSAGPNASLLQTVVVPPDVRTHTSCILQAEPARKLPKLVQVPVLVVTGEASYHSSYDYCTVNYLRQTGVQVTYLDLGRVGIHGNGHFAFMELNNLEIAGLVHEWLLETT